MPRKGITDIEVFEAAGSLVSEGITPTVITLHQRLGRGSHSTINRYFRQWKAQKYRGHLEVDDNLMEEVSALKLELSEQRSLNDALSIELNKITNENLSLNEENNKIKEAFNESEQEREGIENQLALMSAHLENLAAEREHFLSKVTKEKDREIESLKGEISHIHQESLKLVQDISHSSHEKYLREKIENDNLKETLEKTEKVLSALKKKVAFLEGTQKSTEKEVKHQKGAITWEELKAKEAEAQKKAFEG